MTCEHSIENCPDYPHPCQPEGKTTPRDCPHCGAWDGAHYRDCQEA